MHRLPLIILLYFLPAAPTTAQSGSDNTPRNILARISASPRDTSRIDLLMQLGSYYIFKDGEYKTDLDSAMVFLDQALELSNTLHSIPRRNETLKLIGDCYLEGQQLEKGKAAFLQVIDYYHRTGNEFEEAGTWNRLGECIPTHNDEQLEEKARIYEHARSLFHKIKDTADEAHTQKNIGDAHMCEGKLDLAEREFLQALALYRSLNYPVLHDVYTLLATTNRLKGNPDKELYYNLEAIKNMEATGDTNDLSASWFKLGGNYFSASMFDKSVFYYRRSLEFDKKKGYYYDMFSSLASLCNSMAALHQGQEALDLVRKTVRETPPTRTEEKINLNGALGACYTELRQYDKAQLYYQEMIRLFEIQKAKGNMPYQLTAHYYRSICEFYTLTKQYRQARSYLDKLNNLRPGFINPLTLSKIELMRFTVDSASGNFVSAIKHYEQYKKMHDSIFTATKTDQLEELQIQYETEKKDKDLLLQTKNIQILTQKTASQQSQVEKTRVTRNAVIGGSCVLLLLLVVSYNRYRLKRRSNLQLQTQQTEITAKNNELEHLLRDNQWLLREVHHRVKNNLQIVMSLLNSQSAYLQDEAALNAVLESQHRVQAMSLIHQKLYKSNNVSAIYMPEYIHDLVEYLKDSFRTRQNIYFDQLIEPVQLDVLQAVPVGLILNEVITNALKYAFPHTDQDKITIRLLRSAPDLLSLTVADNGRGLPTDFDIEKNGSFGMTLIRGLTEDLDGAFTIESHDGITIKMTFKSTPVHTIDHAETPA